MDWRDVASAGSGTGVMIPVIDGVGQFEERGALK